MSFIYEYTSNIGKPFYLTYFQNNLLKSKQKEKIDGVVCRTRFILLSNIENVKVLIIMSEYRMNNVCL